MCGGREGGSKWGVRREGKRGERELGGKGRGGGMALTLLIGRALVFVPFVEHLSTMQQLTYQNCVFPRYSLPPVGLVPRCSLPPVGLVPRCSLPPVGLVPRCSLPPVGLVPRCSLPPVGLVPRCSLPPVGLVPRCSLPPVGLVPRCSLPVWALSLGVPYLCGLCP